MTKNDAFVSLICSLPEMTFQSCQFLDLIVASVLKDLAPQLTPLRRNLTLFLMKKDSMCGSSCSKRLKGNHQITAFRLKGIKEEQIMIE